MAQPSAAAATARDDLDDARIEPIAFKSLRKSENKYTFTIYDTFDKTNYFNTMGVSTEYLVNFEVLNRIAKEYSLVSENINFFEKVSQTGKKKDATHTLRNNNHIQFQEIFETGKWSPRREGDTITREELELSFLNSTFCFRKIKTQK